MKREKKWELLGTFGEVSHKEEKLGDRNISIMEMGPRVHSLVPL
jgi:hypothetical protein